MKIFAIFNAVAWFAIAIGVLGDFVGWWTFILPELTVFCACLICSINFLNDLMEKE